MAAGARAVGVAVAVGWGQSLGCRWCTRSREVGVAGRDALGPSVRHSVTDSDNGDSRL